MVHYSSCSASQGNLQDDSWWPKPSVWTSSGLDFGAWSPLGEDWYTKRERGLNETTAVCVRSREWKSKIKYQAQRAQQFLTHARSLAHTFIVQNRL